MACVLGALAISVAGCGAEEHVNEQRPQAPTRVSVTITREAITVAPVAIGTGPDHTQQIPQNQNTSQPPIRTKAPLNVVFVTANLTDADSKLKIEGPRSVESEEIFANSNDSFLVDLPAGTYTVSATGVSGAKPATLSVGSYRASSQNDVLLP
jgi:hypothetical protein